MGAPADSPSLRAIGAECVSSPGVAGCGQRFSTTNIRFFADFHDPAYVYACMDCPHCGSNILKWLTTLQATEMTRVGYQPTAFKHTEEPLEALVHPGGDLPPITMDDVLDAMNFLKLEDNP